MRAEPLTSVFKRLANTSALRAFCGAVFVAVFFACPCFAQERAQPEAVIWAGQSGGYAIRWTTANITAESVDKPSKVIFSAKDVALAKFAAFKKENLQEDPAWQCSYTLKFSLLSLVGSVLSYEENESAYCGRNGGAGWNHPADQIHYRVIDLSQMSKQISLPNFFSEDSVMKVLLADATVKDALSRVRDLVQPKTVADLAKAIIQGSEIYPVRSTPEAPKECGFVFPEHPWTEFAFHHLEKGNVAIRLSLVPNSGACHSAHSQLGILLPVPDALKGPLAAAQTRRQGFLMDARKQPAGNRSTVFAFETAPGRRPEKR